MAAVKPLIVIVGQTASGKTQLALDIAEKFNGEVICADSRSVYKGMDIGTAKPSTEEQARVRHHLLDVVSPDETFTVADFKRLADEAIRDIRSRGKVPILVGGSGLFIDSVLYDFKFRPVNTELREKLEKMTVDDLHAMIVAKGLELPENAKNTRYLMRVIESGQAAPQNKKMQPDAFVFGLQSEPSVLADQIERRVEAMIQAGLVDEVKALSERYGWDVPAMLGTSYMAFRPYVDGQVRLVEAKRQFVSNDLKLAKKQRTWFRRNPSIQWADDPRQVVDRITTIMNKSI